jgi:hypothetical protein
VTDTDAGSQSPPTGTVTLAHATGEHGTFTNPGATCTLANPTTTSSSCTVDYTPTQLDSGSQTITATYNASTLHDTSTDDTTLTVTLRTTQTVITCTPATLPLDDTTSCTATVTDTDSGTPSAPAGSAGFGSDASGDFTGNPCTLTPDSSTSSSCQVDYTPTADAGTHTITGAYTANDATHADSADATGQQLTVTLRTTQTTVTGCSPNPTAIAQTTTCTITVTDSDTPTKSWPQGTATLASDGPGTLAGNPCTLTQIGATTTSSCTVTFTPTSFHSGADQITAAYTANDAVHANSADTTGTTLTVTLRTTQTTVTGCSPAAVVVSQQTTCTVRVTDTAAGTASWPQGTVSFTSSGTGAFTGSPCTLAQVGTTATSTCTVTYTPSAASGGTHQIKATYTAGDAVHADSADSTGFGESVSKRTTSTTIISCSPIPAPVNSTVTCTAVVTDTESNGTPTPPGGTVLFSNAGAGDSGVFTGNPCTLSPYAATVAANDSSCTVTYKSATATVDALTAAYTPGDDVHLGSSTEAAAPLLVVFYDASGSFVTGGGWINVPAGSYVANPALAGRANFGFTSKYQKGANAPDGQTEFQFDVGNLNFHSESYQWLVVAGSKAQYKGTGKINGVSGYSFMLTATDGDVQNGGGADKFRIKIWNTATGTIVFDNQIGGTDDLSLAPTEPLSGGSIVIHK